VPHQSTGRMRAMAALSSPSARGRRNARSLTDTSRILTRVVESVARQARITSRFKALCFASRWAHSLRAASEQDPGRASGRRLRVQKRARSLVVAGDSIAHPQTAHAVEHRRGQDSPVCGHHPQANPGRPESPRPVSTHYLVRSVRPKTRHRQHRVEIPFCIALAPSPRVGPAKRSSR